MRITFKAFATLGDYLPREHEGYRRSGNELPMDVAEGTTLQAVIDRFPLPRALVHLVLLLLINPSISRTARSIPVINDRATIAWPIWSHAIPGIAATGATFA